MRISLPCVVILLVAASVNPREVCSQKITATVDTLCASWHICVHSNSGIRIAQLLDECDCPKPMRVYFNSYLDSTLDPNRTNQIWFSGKDTAICFDAYPHDLFDSAYAPIFIEDSDGYVLILDLHYLSPHLQISVFPNLSKKIYYQVFPPTRTGLRTCSTLAFVNTGAVGAKDYNVATVSVRNPNGNFVIDSTIPQLPTVLKPGDTLNVQVCFVPNDTGSFADVVDFENDCLDYRLGVSGIGTSPASVHYPDLSTQHFSITPNPVSGDAIHCNFSTPVSNTRLSIFDVLGRVFYAETITPDVSKLEIPLLNLPPGIYYATLTSQSGSSTQSFVKLK